MSSPGSRLSPWLKKSKTKAHQLESRMPRCNSSRWILGFIFGTWAGEPSSSDERNVFHQAVPLSRKDNLPFCLCNDSRFLNRPPEFFTSLPPLWCWTVCPSATRLLLASAPLTRRALPSKLQVRDWTSQEVSLGPAEFRTETFCHWNLVTMAAHSIQCVKCGLHDAPEYTCQLEWAEKQHVWHHSGNINLFSWRFALPFLCKR